MDRIEKIAVVGIACRFPGAQNHHAFWMNVSSGRNTVRREDEPYFVEDMEFNPAFGVLEDIELFSPRFFGISANEAKIMDPQQRIFIECCYSAIEDAGYKVANMRNVALYGGSGISTYLLDNLLVDKALVKKESEARILYSNDKDYLCSQVSYRLGLDGPSVSVNSACSTSLVAIAQACKSLLAYECDYALAGGVRIDTSGIERNAYVEGGIISKSGRCRPFDEMADGTVFGNGGGVVLLKRLSDAERDNDDIYGVVSGYAVNNDGHDKAGYSTPSKSGQIHVIEDALAFAGVSPDEIDYIEAHGTGTEVGDAIEIDALKKVFFDEKKADGGHKKIFIGTAKANVGHLGAAAGVAGFIKVIGSLIRKKYPILHGFNSLSKHILHSGAYFHFPKSEELWVSSGTRRAGVSSFGIGGTNCHVVLEEYIDKRVGQVPAIPVIPISAKSSEDLARYVSSVKRFVELYKDVDIDEIATTFQIGREGYSHRAFLEYDQNSVTTSENYVVLNEHDSSVGPVIVIPGQDNGLLNVGQGLYTGLDVFREIFDDCNQVFKSVTDTCLLICLDDLLASGFSDDDKARRYYQVVLFSVQYSCAKTLLAGGMQPTAYIGHSFGEYVAAALCGVFSLKDVFELLILREKLVIESEPGSMLSVSLGKDGIGIYLTEGLYISAENSSKNVVVSGRKQDVDRLRLKLKEAGIASKIVNSNTAYHSPVMESVVDDYAEKLSEINYGSCRYPYVSCLKGRWVDEQEICCDEYWIEHFKKPVQFFQGINTLLNSDQTVFVEVAGKEILSHHIRRMSNKRIYAKSFFRGALESYDRKSYWRGLAELWAVGLSSVWGCSRSEKEKRSRKNGLPTYPFKGERHWIEGKSENEGAGSAKENCFYKPTWSPMCLEGAGSKNQSSTIIYLVNESNIFLSYGAKNTCKNIVRIVLSNFTKNDGNDFYISSPQELGKVLELLASRKSGIDIIVNAWPILEGEQEVESCVALMVADQCVVQASQGLSNSIKYVVLTRDGYLVSGSESIVPCSALFSSSAVISSESENVNSLVVDVDAYSLDLLTSPGSDLLKSVLETSGLRGLLAVRKGICFQRKYVPGSKNEREVLVEEGHYIVTGGLGDLAVSLTSWLVKERRSKITLLVRRKTKLLDRGQSIHESSDLNSLSRSERIIERLRAKGHRIQVVQCDVTAIDEVRSSVNAAEESYGAVNGLFHLAGVPSSSLVYNTSISSILNVVNVKARSLLNFSKVFDLNKLDVVVAYSSIASFKLGAAQYSYCAANLYMESLLNKRIFGEKTVTLSVNWDSWKDLGMTRKMPRFVKQDARFIQEMRHALDEEHMSKIYADVFSHSSNLIVSYRNPNEMESLSIFSEGTQNFKDLQASSINVGDDLKTIILKIWQEALDNDNLTEEDDYFEMGGDSLLGTHIAAKINTGSPVKINIGHIYQYPTVSMLVSYINKKEGIGLALDSVEEKLECPHHYGLSEEQMPVWKYAQLDPSSTAYNMYSRLDIRGHLALGKLKSAIEVVLDRHEVLRNNFRCPEDVPYQFVSVNASDCVEIRNISKLRMSECEKYLQSEVDNLLDHRFCLERGPLVRVVIVEQPENLASIYVVMHHIISDAQSSRIIFNQVLEEYFGDGSSSNSVDHYRDYVSNQKQFLSKVNIDRQIEFWETKLEGFDARSDFGNSRDGHSLDDQFLADSNWFDLSEKLSREIKAFAREFRSSVFSLLFCAYAIALHKVCGEEDICVGTPVSNRYRGEVLDNVVGNFVNLTLLRSKISASDSFRSVFWRTSSFINEAFQNRDVSYDVLSKHLQRKLDLGGRPIFTKMFVWQDKKTLSTNINGLQIEEKRWDSRTAKYDINLLAEERNEKIVVQVEFRREIYNDGVIAELKNSFINSLHKIIRGSDELLISKSAARCFPTGPRMSLISPLLRSFSSNFNRIAIVNEHVTLSYEELYRLACNLSRKIRLAGVKPDQLVAIHLPRGWQQVVAVLGVIFSGGAYLPISTSLPAKRKRELLDIGDVSIVVGDNIDCESTTRYVFVECEAIEHCDQNGEQSIDDTIVVEQDPDNLAYVIFTSGSTGVPKGVAITHASVLNTLFDVNKRFNVTECDCVFAISELNFDLSVYDIFGLLIAGGKIVIPSEQYAKDPEYWLDQVQNHGVTLWNSVPAFMDMLVTFIEGELGQGDKCRGLGSLKQVWMSGDWIHPGLPDRIKRIGKDIVVISMGGATEASIWSIYHCVEGESSQLASIPYGKPLGNQHFYILNEDMKECAPSVAGELYIGGAGLAKEYWRDKDRTDKCFIYHKDFNERLYKTGDFGRRDSNGVIEFLGRMDSQVKVGGHRIELGEIESVFSRHVDVVKCVAVLDGGASPKIHAFVVTKTSALERSVLMRYLAEHLPAYMVPSAVRFIDEIPLTTNGKVDRKRLLESIPESQQKTACGARDDIYKQVEEIFSNVVENSDIDRNKSFFENGGDSLSVIHLVNGLKKAGYKIRAKDVFDFPSVNQLGGFLLESHDFCNQENSTENTDYDVEEFGLLPAQKWFFDNRYIHEFQYNQIQHIELSSHLNFALVKVLVEKLVERNVSLRVLFKENIDSNGQKSVSQKYQSLAEVLRQPILTKVRLDDNKVAPEELISTTMRLANRSLDLFSGPLFKFVYFDFKGVRSNQLAIVMHHLLIDARSWINLYMEIDSVIDLMFSGSWGVKKPKPVATSQCVLYLESASMNVPQREIEYWNSVNRHINSVERLFNDEGVESACRKTLVFELLDKAEYENEYHKFIGDKGISEDEHALALLILSVAGMFDLENVPVLLESHGRRIFDTDSFDVEDSIGWFTNFFPAIFSVSKRTGFLSEDIDSIARQIHDIPNMGDWCCVVDIFNAVNSVDLSEYRKPQILFNFLGDIQRYSNSHDVSLIDGEPAYSVVPSYTSSSISSYNVDDICLSVNFWVSERGLSVSLSYVEPIVSREQVEECARQIIRGFRSLGIATVNAGEELVAIEYPEKDEIRVTQPQHDMLLATVIEGESPFYNISSALEIDCAYSTSYLNATIKYMLRRHEILRTYFVNKNGDFYSRVSNSQTFRLAEYDLSEIKSEDARIRKFRSIKQNASAQCFDLFDGPPIAFSAVKVSESKFCVIATLHHSLSDAWSMNVFKSQFKQCYMSLADGGVVEDLVDRFQYADVYHMIAENQQSGCNGRKTDFWSKRIPDLLSCPEISCRRSAVNENVNLGVYHSEYINVELESDIARMAKGIGVTPNAVYLSMYCLSIWNYLDLDDLSIAIPFSRREASIDLSETLGCFINTVPLYIKRTSDIIGLCQYVNKSLITLGEYCDLGMGGVLKLSAERFGVANVPVHAMFNAITVPGGSINDSDNTYENVVFNGDLIPSKLPINIYIESSKAGTRFAAILSNYYFLETEARCFLLNMVDYCRQYSAIYNGKLQQKSGAELALSVAQGLRGCEKPLTDSLNVVDRVKSVAEKRPDLIALIDGDGEWTYEVLWRRVNMLSAMLVDDYEIKKGDRVAICLGRNVKFVASILAVLNIGAVYVPLDEETPVSKILTIARSIKVDTIIAERELHLELSICEPFKHCIDMDGICFESLVNQCISHEVSREVCLDDVAQVLFTSGSTGVPKATVITHRSIANRLLWMEEEYPYGSTEVACHLTSVQYVRAVWELFQPLISGIPIVIFQREVVKDVYKFTAEVSKNKVTRIVTTPSYIAALLKNDISISVDLAHLKYWFVSGEPLPTEIARGLTAKLPGVGIVNLYGATEVTSGYIWHEYDEKADAGTTIVPIGKPILNTEIMVLRADGSPCRVNEVGELYVSSACVAKGYENSPEETAGSFINLYKSEFSEKQFKTGDRGRFDEFGNIHFVSRNDFQVKVRGNKVVYNEIESVIDSFEKIDKSVVFLSEDESLCVSLKIRCDFELPELTRYLKERLFQYQIPGKYFLLQEVHYLNNGKLDRRRTLGGDMKVFRGANVTSIVDESELRLKSIWVSVLGNEQIYRESDFFSSGGHSLLAGRLAFHISNEFNVDFAISLVFNNPVFSDMFSVIGSMRSGSEDLELISMEIDKLLSDVD